MHPIVESKREEVAALCLRLGVRRLELSDPAMAEKIPDLSKIIGFRNIIVHG